MTMGILLALAAAVLYGSSDFGGGLASRRLGSLRVAVVGLVERPSLLSVAGVLVALPAIVLVAASGSVRGKLGAGLLDGLAAGLAFGILFIGLAQAGRNAGLWPVASEQTGALLITLALAVKTREPLRIPLRAAGLPVLVGASGMV